MKSNLNRRGMTLVELLVVLAILGILAGIVLASIQRATLAAKEDKTKSTIHKLNSQLMSRFDAFRTRRVTVDIPPGLNVEDSQLIRQAALYELMRQELPDRWEDVEVPLLNDPPQNYPSLTLPTGGAAIVNGNVIKLPLSSLARAYRRKVNATGTPTDQFQSAECLYMILTTGASKDGIRSGDLANVDSGDKDGDGFLEFHDAWGTPIAFLRWAPGFVSEEQPSIYPLSAGLDPPTTPSKSPSPFDPLKIVPSRSNNQMGQRLIPLIYSAGPDKIHDIQRGSATSNNPYELLTRGQPQDLANQYGPPNSYLNSFDNITNHALGVR